MLSYNLKAMIDDRMTFNPSILDKAELEIYEIVKDLKDRLEEAIEERDQLDHDYNMLESDNEKEIEALREDYDRQIEALEDNKCLWPNCDFTKDLNQEIKEISAERCKHFDSCGKFEVYND
jgi:hypothetical protein